MSAGALSALKVSLVMCYCQSWYQISSPLKSHTDFIIHFQVHSVVKLLNNLCMKTPFPTFSFLNVGKIGKCTKLNLRHGSLILKEFVHIIIPHYYYYHYIIHHINHLFLFTFIKHSNFFFKFILEIMEASSFRPKRKEDHSIYYQSTFQEPASMMLWGCISEHGIMGNIIILHIYEGTINAGLYLQVLEQHMPPSRQENLAYFSKINHILLVLQQHSSAVRVQVPNWFVCSPDL